MKPRYCNSISSSLWYLSICQCTVQLVGGAFEFFRCCEILARNFHTNRPLNIFWWSSFSGWNLHMLHLWQWLYTKCDSDIKIPDKNVLTTLCLRRKKRHLFIFVITLLDVIQFCQFLAETYPRELERNTYTEHITAQLYVFVLYLAKTSNNFYCIPPIKKLTSTRGQTANPSSCGKWPLKRRVCVYSKPLQSPYLAIQRLHAAYRKGDCVHFASQLYLLTSSYLFFLQR